MSSIAIKVLCVDDSPDIAGLLEISINSQPDMQAIGCLHAADDVLQAVARDKPDVILLDLTMPGKDPLEVIAEINRLHPKSRTIIYSGYDGTDTVNQAIEAGAWGFISKHREVEHILSAIRRVAKGELAMPQE